MWYKTYPPKGSDKAPAIIIPELQHRASIVALGYTTDDLTPPGQPNKRFNTKGMRLAHSLDGVHWSMLPTSVVDQENRTVAALDKVGGYYMIVAGCQGGTSSGVSLGVSTTPLQKTSPVSNQKLPIKATPAQPTYAVTPQQKIVKQKTNQNPSLLQGVSSYIQNLF